MTVKTADRRERHPSRYQQESLLVEYVENHVKQTWAHFGYEFSHVQMEGIWQLAVAIALAKVDEGRFGDGKLTRERIVAALKGMDNLAENDLIAALKNCDMATYGRIQTAHAELYYARNGIPVIDIPDAGLSKEDWIAACNGDKAAFIHIVNSLIATKPDADESANHLTPGLVIELPTANRPLNLPLGIDGLRRAISFALDKAEAEKGKAGNPSKPHHADLAMACRIYWRKHGPTSKQRAYKVEDEKHTPPLTVFASGIFILAGIEVSDSRIVDLLKARSKRKKN